MKSPNQKKTDRRTLYTQMVIKDALLELNKETAYDKINVTMVCRQAEIARATFYLHFDSLDEVLDSVIDDALLFSESGSGTVVDVLDIIRSGRSDVLSKNETVLPACQRIADSDKYHHLFMDVSVSDHIIQRIAAHEHDKFILNGSFAVNRSLSWEKNERWYRYQQILGRFINAGIER